MELLNAEILCKALMSQHGITKYKYKFKWNNSIRIFGMHRGHTRSIELSKKLVLLNSEEEVRDTILHEIAHALDYIRNGFKSRCSKNGRRLVHDQKWKDICVEIGCKPKATYSSKEVNCPKRKFRYMLIDIQTRKVIAKEYRKPMFYDNGYDTYLKSDGTFGKGIWVKAPKSASM